ncbi:hypothetical protein GCM10009430_17860 [Aquimarina litoralis]|uniref:DUF4138 domain-containing protein n=1 Tax=Aquimarina litoralis TaxID=584605 RepID=A0ABP3TW44_9FLAO
MKLNFIKPTYAIQVSLVGCQLEVKCNDTHVFEYKSKSSQKGNGLSITVPINHLLLKNDVFTITAKVLPVHGKDTLKRSAYAQIQIVMLDYVAPNETNTALFTTETPSQTTENDEIKPKIDLEGLPFYILKAGATASILPYSLTGWMDSIDFSSLNRQKLLTDTYHFYKKVINYIDQKDIVSFSKITQEQNTLLEIAYYYGSREIKREKQQLENIFNETGLQVVPFNFEDIEMEFMGTNNQLLRLKRRNGFPILMLYNPINQKTIKLDLKLQKKTLEAPLSII